MTPFVRLTGVAAGLPLPNVDTDMIIPADFLKTVSREGLGQGLFHRLRFDASGSEQADFVLNREPWRSAEILIAGENFGCGSSREHAPWALLDLGIRCIIAPSFAEIFAQNAVKNGMLLISLAPLDVATLLEDAASSDRARMSIDLELCTIARAGGSIIPFTVDALGRARLLGGFDDVALSLLKSTEIGAYERDMRGYRPWTNAIALP